MSEIFCVVWKNMSFGSFLKSYLKETFLAIFIVLMTAFLFLGARYTAYKFDITSLKSVDTEKLDALLIQFFKDDFQHKFVKNDFLHFYSDVGYLLQSKQININNYSLSEQFLEARNKKTYTRSMQAFEQGSMFAISEKLKDRFPEINTFYINPTNTTQNIYLKIYTHDNKIYLINKPSFDKLNTKEFIHFETLGAIFVIPSAEIYKSYNRSLVGMIDIAKANDKQVLTNFETSVSGFLKELIIGILILIFALLYSVIKHLQKIFVRKEEIYKDIYKREEEITRREEIVFNIEHILQHDTKTNIDERNEYLTQLYHDIKNLNTNSSTESIQDMIVFLFALDLTVKLSNDYIRSTPLKVAHFIAHLQKEKLFKYAEGNLDSYGEIGKKILEKVIIFDINPQLGKLDDFPIANEFFENEFTCAVFRLINNALKHSSDHKAEIKIGYDFTNTFNITIINEVENVDKSLYNIETSLSGDDGIKNISHARESIKKFDMVIDYEQDKQNSKILTIIKRIGDA
ncbi:MAG: hypothetical protein PHX13_00890 [Thiovulaceae bacterium]|nr:hypothetical protein [Sulfurimonadaceae bacterium]